MSELRPRPLWREVTFDEPCVAYRKLRSADSIVFESVKGPESIARYSFVCIEPYLCLKVTDEGIEIDVEGRKTVSQRPPLARLRELIDSYRQETIDGLPPFQGGAAGLLTYDFVHYIEKLPRAAKDDLGVPYAHFYMFDRVVSFDHLARRAWVIVCPGARENALGYSELVKTEDDLLGEAKENLDRICRRLEGPAVTTSSSNLPSAPIVIAQDVEKDAYMSIVRKVKDYIASGDIFQANLSLRVSAPLGGRDPWRLYEILREINPSPFACFGDFRDYQIVSSSPERLVRVRDGKVDTRPIAGTRPRGRDGREDELMRAELLLSDKERAEHIMLIDLERNDLGRVCAYGSIGVDELMVTEDYSHVIHIVSNVKGLLAAGKDCFDVIRAVFPGGTITGVPKVRCMEIIDELETMRRGPYTGSMGYIGFGGAMDMNIIIRTFLIAKDSAYIQAGAGIVADSDPEREYYESLKKAEALIRTLERL